MKIFFQNLDLLNKPSTNLVTELEYFLIVFCSFLKGQKLVEFLVVKNVLCENFLNHCGMLYFKTKISK